MRVTVLIENTTDSELACEFGLSLYIEAEGKKILLDAGATGAFAENAEKLGVDLSAVDAAVLSHGHSDHSDGFPVFLDGNQTAEVWAMEDVFRPHFVMHGDSRDYIGVSDLLAEKYRNRFHLIGGTEAVEIYPGIFLVPHGEEDLKPFGERVRMEVPADGGGKDGPDFAWDDFSHELSLVCRTEKGLVILNSCSHGGIQNILEDVKHALPEEKPWAFIGGLHMKGGSPNPMFCLFKEQEIQKIAQQVRRSGLTKIWTGHCTGEMGFRLMEKYLPERMMNRFTSGTVIEI